MKAAWLLWLALAFFPAPPARAQATPPVTPARVALVIGNAAYPTGALPNASNDAVDIARELEAAGFLVILRRDATLKEMHLALREFGDKLGRNTTGLFYFAGHGLQVKGRNYLVPVDADMAREDEVAFSAMDLAAVMEKLDSARNPVNLVILDACRNNPFASRFQLAAKGLAQVDAPPGTLIAFATAPGSVAADGQGRNGLYTSHLLEQMRRPGVPVEEVLKATRAAVRKASASQQVPWESTSLESTFMFRSAPPKAAPARVASVDKGAAATRGVPRQVPVSAPPLFTEGDKWTYRMRNLLDGSERQVNMSVKKLKGHEVEWGDGAVSDLFGNFTRNRQAGEWQTFTPSTQLYVFPLREGATYELDFVQVRGERTFDGRVRLVVGPEEEVETPAGRFRATRFERVVDWKRRGKDKDAGTNRGTYWYTAAAKRWIASDVTNTLRSGKVIQRERWELETYSVK